MKKIILLFLTTAITFLAQAQVPLILGMTESDGANGFGTIFNYTGGDTAVNGEFSFPANFNFAGPYSTTLTVAKNGVIYGLNANDGNQGFGTLFTYNYGLNNYTVLANFDSAAGEYPFGALVQATNGLFYGLTSGGDSTYGGTLFSYTPGDTEVAKLVTLASGAMPQGSLIQSADGRLYGITNGDGTNGSGTIFQYNIATGAYNVQYNFPLNAYPTGNLLEVGADTLYGITNGDGTYGGGTMFRYKVGEVIDTVVYNFSQGANANSALMRAGNGLLYGLTNADGYNSEGTIFSYNTDSTIFEVLYSFGSDTGYDSLDGAYPTGGLMQASDGWLYGTTSSGGLYGSGTIFRFNPATATYEKMVDLTTTSGDYPGAGFLTQYRAVPVSVINPVAATVCAGTTAGFVASASGGQPITVQWQVSADGGTTYSNITGATDSSYYFTTTLAQNNYLYRAIFTNTLGADTTTAANLTVVSINNTATVSDATCTAAQATGTYQWFNCDSGTVITDATAQTFTATQNGNYSCIVTAGNCTDTTNCVAVTVLGIPNVQAYNFALYPNPTSGTCIITNNYNGTLKVQVLSVIGDKLKEFTLTGNQTRFDISSLASGIYQVVIADDTHELKVLKLVKE